MRVAMTGATGFAGRLILNALLMHGHSVTMLVRSATTNFPLEAKAVVGDLENEGALSQLCAGADVIVHVAGAIAARDRAAFMRVNVRGTENVLRHARAAHVKRIVHVSSLAARVPEISDYAASKHEGERLVLSGSTDHLVLRPPAIYGPGDKATLPLIQQLAGRIAIIPGRPSSRFSMLEVSDFAQIVADAVVSKEIGMREVDDTAGGYSWPDVADTVRGLMGRPKRVIYLPKSAASTIGFLADAVSRVTGQQAMVTSGKVREMYYPDWVSTGPGWPRSEPVRLRAGLLKTLNWYIAAGLVTGAIRDAA